jgi:uncharacterized tellurite resistance protein B-like protein|tara:strand:+ start:264 stop:683 length:420 start_codon:yes stop_codon:yes gene_type:complete
MFNFLKKKELKKNKNDLWIKTASLLIHAAKIDQNFTEKEKDIIKKTLIELGAEQVEINNIIIKAEAKEEESHQILEFTREIKNTNEKFKIKIVETLWRIIYSDKTSDIYESNLMRRLTGLLYIDNKTMGDIKARIKKNN